MHIHLRSYLPQLACVALGGFVGTGLRYAADSLAVQAGVAPALTLLLLNLPGALVLGFIYGYPLHTRAGAQRQQILRLIVATGLCGALTSYGGMISRGLDLAPPVPEGLGAWILPVAYLLGSLVLGVLCALLGGWLAGQCQKLRAAAAGGRAC